MKKFLIPVLAPFFLVGCKSEIDLPVKYSQVFGEIQQEKTASLILEVPSCTEHGTEMESSSVLEAKQKVSYLFPSSKYKKCERKSFDSYVVFEVPFYVGGIGVKDCKKDQICVASSQNNLNMNVFVGEGIRKKLEQIKRGISLFDPSDLQIALEVINDSGSELLVKVPSAFQKRGGKLEPLHHFYGEFSKTTVTVVLSNVAAAQLLTGRGVATAIEFPKRDFREPSHK